jgi:hypothetical protein
VNVRLIMYLQRRVSTQNLRSPDLNSHLARWHASLRLSVRSPVAKFTLHMRHNLLDTLPVSEGS